MPKAPLPWPPRSKVEKSWASRQTPWRDWYNEWLWRGPNGLRMQVLALHPCCRICELKGIVEPSTRADHIIPHAGNRELFESLDNLWGLCLSCHSIKTKWDEQGVTQQELAKLRRGT